MFDTLIVLTVAATLSFRYIMKPMIDSPVFSGNLASLFVNVSSPMLDLGVLFGIMSIFLATRGIFPVITFFFLFTGFLIQIFADTSYLYFLVTNTYEVGNGVDPLWLIALLMIGMSGLYYEAQSKFSPAPMNGGTKNIISKVDYVRLSIPYLGVVFLFVVMLMRLQEMDGIVIGSALSLLLVIIRQIYVA